MDNSLERDYIVLLKKTLMGCMSEFSFNEIGVGKRKGFRKILQLALELIKPRSLKLVRLSRGNPQIRLNRSDSSFGSFTLVGERRLDFLEDALRTISREKIEGAVLEAGVWRGGAAIFIKKMLDILGEKRTLYCADSFEGMPKPQVKQDVESDKGDYSGDQYYSVSVDQVRANFEQFNANGPEVHFVKGWFSESLPGLKEERYSLLRIDCDLYQSTMDVLVNLYQKVSPGGFIYIDDYNSWEPCKKAVTDFRQDNKINGPIIQVDPDSVYWRK